MWGGFGGMGGAAFGRSHRFEEQYHCYSVSVADKAHLEVSAGECLYRPEKGALGVRRRSGNGFRICAWC
jgi:hypothetical protein